MKLHVSCLFFWLLTTSVWVKSEPIPRENIVVTGHKDNVARIWNYETGKLLGERPDFGRGAISPDGNLVAGRKKIWNISTGSLLPLEFRNSELTGDMMFTLDGKYVVCGGGVKWAEDELPNSCTVWDVQTGKIFRKSPGFPGWTMIVLPLPDPNLLLVQANSSKVCRYNIEKNEIEEELFRDFCLRAVSPDGKYVINGSHGGWFRNLDDPKKVVWRTHNIANARFLPNNQGVVVVHFGDNPTASIREIATGKEILKLEYLDDCFDVSSDSRYIATRQKENLCFLSTETGAILTGKTIKTPSEITSIRFGLAKATLDERAEKAKAEKEAAQRKARKEAAAEAEKERLEKIAAQREKEKAELESKLEEGFNLLKAGEKKLAFEAFEAAAALDEKDTNAEEILALLELFWYNKSEEAYGRLQKCVRRDVKNLVHLNNFGVVCILEFKYSTALTAFEKAAELQPDAPELVQNVGLLMERHKKNRRRLTPPQIARLAKLHATVVEANLNLFDPAGPYKLLPLREGACNRPDCDPWFTQRKTAKNRTPQPFEYQK